MPIEEPATATPSAIDFELARLESENAKAQDAIHRLSARVKTFCSRGMLEEAAELRPLIERARRTTAECQTAQRHLDAEFQRRGGWTRAWLVLNSGGHVHRTTGCRTCFPSTRFTWLTNFSGHDEIEIVDEAGEAACTECYPSAPVEVRNRPSRIKTPERLAREAQKAERAKTKAAKAITAPDGTPLRTEAYGRIDTEFTARRIYADVLAYARYLDRGDYDRHRDAILACQEDAHLILAALAAKHGRTEHDLREEMESNVESRWRRAYS